MLGRSCGRRWTKTERLFLILNEKLKVDKTDWKRHSRPAVVNAFYSSIENSIQVFFVHPTFMNIYIIQFPFIF